ncbi:MAG: hypothetical protein WA003_01225 [Desulfuromonadaceae bacterium]
MITYGSHDFRPITDRHVIFSSDDNANYYFTLPIAAMAWKKIEYRPVISLVWGIRDIHKSDLKSLVLNSCNKFGAWVQVIDANIITNDNRFNGYNLSMLAQISRFCSSSFFYDDDEYFLTSDSDMIPAFNSKWFHQQDKDKDIHLFYANGYHHTRYPVCYCGMYVKTWRELFGLLDYQDIYSDLKILLKNLKPNDTIENQWGYDEKLFFSKISKYNKYPDNCHMIDRRVYVNPKFRGQPKTPRLLPYGRLDRSNFYYNNVNLDENGWIDIHCMREPWKPDNWKILREALSELVFEEYEMKLIDEYYMRFIKYV